MCYIASVVLCLFVLIYIVIIATMYWYRNPIIDSSGSIPTSTFITESIITHTRLGLRGDMGNQMFQLACIIAAGRRSQAKVVLPTRTAFLPIAELFDLTDFEWNDVVPDAVYREYDNYEHIVIPGDGRVYDIRGYRQAYKYFEDAAEEIRRIFTPKLAILSEVRKVVPSEYIVVHIRRGDYVKPIHTIPLLREFRRCQLDYYKQGIRKLRESYPECPVLVCTDSPTWVAPLLSELDTKAVIAPVPDGIDPKFSDFCTLYLAAAVVISNSTFSWMSSYLNPGRLIICPSPWWDPDGFIAKAVNLDKNYLQYPDWWLLDTDTGAIVREPYSDDIRYDDDGTLTLYKLVRGMIL